MTDDDGDDDDDDDTETAICCGVAVASYYDYVAVAMDASNAESAVIGLLYWTSQQKKLLLTVSYAYSSHDL